MYKPEQGDPLDILKKQKQRRTLELLKPKEVGKLQQILLEACGDDLVKKLKVCVEMKKVPAENQQRIISSLKSLDRWISFFNFLGKHEGLFEDTQAFLDAFWKHVMAEYARLGCYLDKLRLLARASNIIGQLRYMREESRQDLNEKCAQLGKECVSVGLGFDNVGASLAIKRQIKEASQRDLFHLMIEFRLGELLSGLERKIDLPLIGSLSKQLVHGSRNKQVREEDEGMYRALLNRVQLDYNPESEELFTAPIFADIISALNVCKTFLDHPFYRNALTRARRFFEDLEQGKMNFGFLDDFLRRHAGNIKRLLHELGVQRCD